MLLVICLKPDSMELSCNWHTGICCSSFFRQSRTSELMNMAVVLTTECGLYGKLWRRCALPLAIKRWASESAPKNFWTAVWTWMICAMLFAASLPNSRLILLMSRIRPITAAIPSLHKWRIWHSRMNNSTI